MYMCADTNLGGAVNMRSTIMVIVLLFLGSITAVSGVFRLDSVAGWLQAGALPANELDRRYVEHPWLSYLHIVPGMVFFLLAPFQFVARIRTRWPGVHRWVGRVAATAALTAAITSIAAAIVFPAYGNWLSAFSSYVFGTYMTLSLVLAYRAIRNKQVARHRVWMIRAFTIGLGVTSIRIFFGVFGVVFGMDFEQGFGPSFLAGFLLNAVIAEIIIRKPFQRLAKS
jgi:hypothetical protein